VQPCQPVDGGQMVGIEAVPHAQRKSQQRQGAEGGGQVGGGQIDRRSVEGTDLPSGLGRCRPGRSVTRNATSVARFTTCVWRTRRPGA
jgi:hypothetical protein